MRKLRRTFLTRDQITERLAKNIAASGLSMRNWAIQHGVSNSLVSAVIAEKTPPGPAIMRALGISPEAHFPIISKPQRTDNRTEPDDAGSDTEATSPKQAAGPAAMWPTDSKM